MRFFRLVVALGLSAAPMTAAAQTISWCYDMTYTDGSPISMTGPEAFAGFRLFCGATPGTYTDVQDLGMGSLDPAGDASCKTYGPLMLGYKSGFTAPFATNYCTMTARDLVRESAYAPEYAFNWPLNSTTSPFAPQNMRISKTWALGGPAFAQAKPVPGAFGRVFRRSELEAKDFSMELVPLEKRLAALKAAGAGRPGHSLSAPKAQIHLADAGAPPKG